MANEVTEVYSSKKGSIHSEPPPPVCQVHETTSNFICQGWTYEYKYNVRMEGATLVIEFYGRLILKIRYDSERACVNATCEGDCQGGPESSKKYELAVILFQHQAGNDFSSKYGTFFLDKDCPNWITDTQNFENQSAEFLACMRKWESRGSVGENPCKKPAPFTPCEGDWKHWGTPDAGLDKPDSGDWFDGVIPKSLLDFATGPFGRDFDFSPGTTDVTSEYPDMCHCVGQRTLGPVTYPATRGNDGTNFDHTNSVYDDPEDVLILEEPGLTFMVSYFTHTNQVADEPPNVPHDWDYTHTNQIADEGF